MDWGRSSTLSMPTWCSPTREKGMAPSSSIRVRVVGGVEVFREVVLPGAWKGGGEYAPASSLSGPRVRLSGGFGRLSAARASSFSFPRCALRGCLVVMGLEPSTDLPPAGCLRETETDLLPARCPAEMSIDLLHAGCAAETPIDLLTAGCPAETPIDLLTADCPAEMSIDLLPAGCTDECRPLLPNDLPPWPPLEGVGRVGAWWAITGGGAWSSFLLLCSAAEMISMRHRTLSLCGTGG